MQLSHLSRFALVFAASALSAHAVAAQDGRRLFEFYGDGFSRAGGFGASIAVVGDIDKDSVLDVAVGEVNGGRSFTGLVELISGASGRRIRQLVPGTGDRGIGEALAGVGDVDNDGTPDVLTASKTNVSLFSGKTGARLRVFSAAAASAVASAGDWNNDQVPDLAWLVSSVVTIASGKDGSVLATLVGARDLCSIGSGLAIVSSSGAQLYRSGQSSPAWTVAGYTGVRELGDLDRDGRQDVLALGATSIDALSGLDGKLLRSFPTGSSARGGHDLDGDGVPDVAVGVSQDSGGQGVVRVYSGKDASLLWSYAGQEGGDQLGWDVATHPGAGTPARPVVLASAPGRFNGSVDAGSLLAIARARAGEYDGAFRPFGRNCNFQNEHLRPGTGLPTIGASYGFRFDSQQSTQGFMLLVIGASNTSWGSIPLPIILPGGLRCPLLVSPDIFLPGGLSTFVSLPIPNTPSLVRQELFVQGLSAFSGQFTTSDGASIRVGN